MYGCRALFLELLMSVDRFVIVETPSLTWPADLQISSKYFRLFVAADTTSTSSDQIAAFARNALMSGMVYCCSWGPDCERFHDIVDEVWIASDQSSDRLLVRPGIADTVMTTWHDDETLEDALEFFVHSALPTNGYEAKSSFWVAVAVANSNWTKVMREQTETCRSLF
jgi:hypothetical protein